jgi:hypothetical protein
MARASVGFALAAGLALGAACIAVSFTLDNSVGSCLRALGVLLPGLLVQDAWRFVFMAAARPASAAANDGCWVVLQLIGIGGLLLSGTVSATSLVLVWGGAANAAAVVGAVQAHAVPSLRSSAWWFWAHRELAPRYGLESIAHRSGAWLAFGVVGAVAGLPVVAGVRGAVLIVIGPLGLLFAGAGFVALPETARLFQRAPERLPRAALLLSTGITVIAGIWCAAVLLAPDELGRAVLGDTWPLASPLLLVLTLHALLQALSIGPGQGLWAMGAAASSLRVQLANVALTLVFMVTGAALGGARGSVLGLTLATLLTTVLWWQQFRQAHRRAALARADPDVRLTAEEAMAGGVS